MKISKAKKISELYLRINKVKQSFIHRDNGMPKIDKISFCFRDLKLNVTPDDDIGRDIGCKLIRTYNVHIHDVIEKLTEELEGL